MTAQELERLRSELAAGLPIRAHWTVGPTSLAYSFLPLGGPLRSLSEALGPLHDGLPDLTRYRVIGGQSYAEGGGAVPLLVLSTVDGSVAAFDAEAPRPLRPLNTTVERFIRSFHALDAFMTDGAGGLTALRASLAAIDPAHFPESDWHALVDELAYHTEA